MLEVIDSTSTFYRINLKKGRILSPGVEFRCIEFYSVRANKQGG
jgi:hypothetical protein